MPVPDLFEPLSFARGPELKNRLLLAPLTNKQSNEDGTVSDHDLAWIARCAQGGYGMTMTCAANVQAVGKGFHGQLGIYDDRHTEGLAQLATLIRASGSVSSVQLHHSGARGLGGVNGVPAGPSEHISDGARTLSTAGVQQLRDDFIAAAQRADSAGFDGVEVHGAFGHVLAQFLSPTLNTRRDEYGGSLERRSRLLFEIIEGIRSSCRPDFQVGLRLSMERFGLRVAEIRDVAAEAIYTGSVDYLDIAPHDIDKTTDEAAFKGRTLLSLFTDLPRRNVRLGASGKVMSARKAASALEAGCDFVMVGRAAILQPDFPKRVQSDHGYHSPELPVSQSHLENSGLSPAFINYMQEGWDGFVATETAQATAG
jgi:2,4-dienoyl-CoA reductase-like NADH-dependent reductase (Old Yellow Enzyme family)